MAKARRFTKGENVVARKIRGNLVLVPLGTGNARLDCVYTLNETACIIWDRALQGMSEDAIVSSIADEYGIDEETAREDSSQLLTTLLDIGALHVAAAEG